MNDVMFEERLGPLMYLVGEALVGEGNEVAHIDLVVGEKEGPIGQAFAAGLANLSVGHTPLLAVIRPNLPPKPFTLIVPKVTVKGMEEAEKIFGPAQAAVAKAVADSVEEGVVPKEKVDDLVIICSVFIHPEAKDYRRIFHYNYSATKLALNRAFSNYPSLEKIMYEKDRAKHPIMGFKVPRLWNPPYLQIAIDLTDVERVKNLLKEIPRNDRVIFEVGTPLIKKYGARVIAEIRELVRDSLVVADLKTLDVGQVEVDIAFDETADAVVVSGLASKETADNFIYEAKRLGIYSVMDMMAVEDPMNRLRSLRRPPDIVILHRGIDEEKGGKTRWELLKEIKSEFKDRKILVAVAGGIEPSSARSALEMGADILVVGRYITQSKEPRRATNEFLEILGVEADLYRVHEE